MTEFASPGASGGSFNVSDHNGHLVVVEVHSYETGIVTSLGEKDAIKATVHDIDAGASTEDALIFPKVLVSSLKGRVGQKVLATVGQGLAKPGQNAPWVLNDASGDPAAAARATAYLAAWSAGQFASPAERDANAWVAPQPAPAQPATPAQAAQHTAAAAPPQVDLTDPNVVAALAALQAQGLVK